MRRRRPARPHQRSTRPCPTPRRPPRAVRHKPSPALLWSPPPCPHPRSWTTSSWTRPRGR
eukprot:10048951-Alexandrium_andersonii.AAC.1